MDVMTHLADAGNAMRKVSEFAMLTVARSGGIQEVEVLIERTAKLLDRIILTLPENQLDCLLYSSTVFYLILHSSTPLEEIFKDELDKIGGASRILFEAVARLHKKATERVVEEIFSKVKDSGVFFEQPITVLAAMSSIFDATINFSQQKSEVCPSCGKTKLQKEWEPHTFSISNKRLSVVSVGFKCECGHIWGH